MRLSVSKEVLEQVVNYLSCQPFKDVVGLITNLEKDIVVIEEEAEEEKHDE